MTRSEAKGASRPLIFLGGTAARNDWRRSFVARLVERGVPRESFFDPVVKNWDEAARAREEEAKASADLLVFFLGDPKDPGIPVSAFALVEAALSICNEPGRTLIVFDLEEVEDHARKVLEQSEKLFRQQDPSVPIFRDVRQAEEWIAGRFASGSTGCDESPAGGG